MKIKKHFSLLAFLGFALWAYGQYEKRVGINTTQPKATLEVAEVPIDENNKKKPQGVIFPHISTAERNTFTNVPEGTMIYNTTKNCIDWYDGAVWKCTNGTQVDVAFTPSEKCLSLVYDRCFGKTTLECLGYGADVREHDFIYCEIQGPDGRRWLNNNLGAEYARVGSSVFDPTKQATSKTDHNAYGSLFQWQRKPDGHELVNWSGAVSGTMKYGYNPMPSASWTTPGDNRSMGNAGIVSWVKDAVNTSGIMNLWNADGENNPCPDGYRVPTNTEHQTLVTFIPDLWSETTMKLPAAGYRGWGISSIALGSTGAVGHYWSNKGNIDTSYSLKFTSTGTEGSRSEYRANGFSVRCIKN
ncbi:hypothetical protein D1J36_004610 [Riemerella anatipestifer]|nr:FISUMP domain-containing protein [Riemerella anatipestifer]USL96389.1 hypothetical protein D1J36_004610 [Riemerella anatipestifer]